MTRTIQHTLSLFLSLCLLAGLAVPARAAEAFTDVAGDHWAYDAIQACAEQEIVNGMGGGIFDPEGEVTSLQFIVMLTRAFYGERLAETGTPDGEAWFYPYVKAAEETSLSDGLTVDESPMSRYDMALALYHILVEENEQLRVTSAQLAEAQAAVPDWDGVQEDYAGAMRYSYALGILNGADDGLFHGEQTVTRAQACAVIKRLLDLTAEPITVEEVLAILAEMQEDYPDGMIWTGPGAEDNHWYEDGPASGIRDTARDVVNVAKSFLYTDGETTGNNLNLQYACGGWMAMVSERIFGRSGAPGREVESLAGVRPGDMVFYLNDDGVVIHVAIVAYTEGPYTFEDPDTGETITGWDIAVCDGNHRSQVKWPDGEPHYWYEGDLGTFARVVTRYS